MATINCKLHLPPNSSIQLDPETGEPSIEFTVEDEDWEQVTLEVLDSEHHNSARLRVNNNNREEAVIAAISVNDPRGAFVMYSEVNETGHYLSTPTNKDSQPHVHQMEERTHGFYKLVGFPSLKEEEE